MLDILRKEIFRTLHPGIFIIQVNKKKCKDSKVYCVLSHFSHVRLFTNLWTTACQAPLSAGFSRQENWSGLPCPPPVDLLGPGIKPVFLTSNLQWQEGALSLAPPGKPKRLTNHLFGKNYWRLFSRRRTNEKERMEYKKDLWTENSE